MTKILSHSHQQLPPLSLGPLTQVLTQVGGLFELEWHLSRALIFDCVLLPEL